MKQIQIITAYNKMESLADNKNLSKENQWALYKLRKALKPHFDFQIEQEEGIRDKYLPFVNEQQMLPPDKTQEYLKELDELGNLEIEMEDFEKVKIPLVDGINFKMMEELENFIEFYTE